MSSSHTAFVGDLTEDKSDGTKWQDESAVIPLVDLTEDDGPILPKDQVNDEDINDYPDDADDDDYLQEIDASTFAASRIPEGFRERSSAEDTLGGRVLPGKSYELHSEGGQSRFLRVRCIYTHRHTGETILRGHLLCRLKHHRFGTYQDTEERCQKTLMQGLFSNQLNELVVLMQGVHTDRADPDLATHMVDRPLSDVLVEREIIFTNLLYARGKFNDYSFRDAHDQRLELDPGKNERLAPHGKKWSAYDHYVLVCRWKSVEYAGKHGQRGECGALLRLRQHEADARHGIPDAALEHWWRVGEELGRAPTQIPPGWTIPIDGEDELSANAARPPLVPQEHVAADFGCGVGGSMAGIESAGLRVVLCLDKKMEAIKSIRAGFALDPQSILHMTFHEFCTVKPHCRVDTLHLSYPCQPNSPANTNTRTLEGLRRNEENLDAAMCIIQLAQILRPKQITFEQTFGILHSKKVGAFCKMVNELTTLSHSLRWKVVKCTEHGVPSIRKRLLIFAAW